MTTTEKAVFSAIGKEQLKNIEALELNNSEVYLVVLKNVTRESFSDVARYLSEAFVQNNISTIIVPENYIDIYKLEK